ncbi:hypothetical protein ACIQYW_18365 [Rhodococcus erythropolis]|uniref:hypothetical protein n=1 Tax=Rhodococcus baikonurensis TaxID=172041 RepID=UPI003393082E
MGLFNRGQGASSLILDEARAFRAYLGDQLVWDGTMDAFVPVPHILVSVTMADPMVSATALTVVPSISASAQVHEPLVSGTATVRPETAILVTGAVNAPDVSADALIDVPAISVTAIALAPTVSEAFDATVEAPFIQVTAGMYSPQITVDYASTVPIIAAFAELLAPLVTATGTAVVNAPMIAVTGTLPAPIVRGASAVAAPMIVVSATVYAPELRRDAKVTAPLITATVTAFVPNVQGINFQPQGMNLTSNFTFKTTTPLIVAPMAARAALPTSVVTANKLIMQNPGPVRAAWIARITTYSGDTVTGSIWNNGILVSAGAAIANPPFNRGAIISGQTAEFTVAQGDGVELRVRSGNANFDQSLVSPDVQLNIYKADQPSAVGTRTAAQTGITTWADLIPSSVPAGAVMSGNAFVAQFSHPEMLLAADLLTSSPYAIAVRILVNGIDIGITGTAGANDGRLTAAGRANIVAGDLVLVQAQRTGGVGTLSVNTGSSWGIV